MVTNFSTGHKWDNHMNMYMNMHVISQRFSFPQPTAAHVGRKSSASPTGGTSIGRCGSGAGPSREVSVCKARSSSLSSARSLLEEVGLPGWRSSLVSFGGGSLANAGRFLVCCVAFEAQPLSFNSLSRSWYNYDTPIVPAHNPFASLRMMSTAASELVRPRSVGTLDAHRILGQVGRACELGRRV